MPKRYNYIPPSKDQIRQFAFKTCHGMGCKDVQDKQDFAHFLTALTTAYANKLTREQKRGAKTCRSNPK